jgi:hypothetical protein
MRQLGVCVLLGVVLVACGSRADLLGSPGGALDASGAGATPEPSADPGVDHPMDGAAGGVGATGQTGAMADAGGPSPGTLPQPPQADADSGGVFQVSCVSVDLRDYDGSCNADSDCMLISSGTICPSQCIDVCPNAAINVSGYARYRQTLAQLPPDSTFCECGAIGASDAYCMQGVCMSRR